MFLINRHAPLSMIRSECCGRMSFLNAEGRAVKAKWQNDERSPCFGIGCTMNLATSALNTDVNNRCVGQKLSLRFVMTSRLVPQNGHTVDVVRSR
jgi:hypothetical protein